MANLLTKIMVFLGFDSSTILILRGGTLMSYREFPGLFESTNLSRDNLSRGLGVLVLAVALVVQPPLLLLLFFNYCYDDNNNNNNDNDNTHIHNDMCMYNV